MFCFIVQLTVAGVLGVPGAPVTSLSARGPGLEPVTTLSQGIMELTVLQGTIQLRQRLAAVRHFIYVIKNPASVKL